MLWYEWVSVGSNIAHCLVRISYFFVLLAFSHKKAFVTSLSEIIRFLSSKLLILFQDSFSFVTSKVSPVCSSWLLWLGIITISNCNKNGHSVSTDGFNFFLDHFLLIPLCVCQNFDFWNRPKLEARRFSKVYKLLTFREGKCRKHAVKLSRYLEWLCIFCFHWLSSLYHKD